MFHATLDEYWTLVSGLIAYEAGEAPAPPELPGITPEGQAHLETPEGRKHLGYWLMAYGDTLGHACRHMSGEAFRGRQTDEWQRGTLERSVAHFTRQINSFAEQAQLAAESEA